MKQKNRSICQPKGIIFEKSHNQKAWMKRFNVQKFWEEPCWSNIKSGSSSCYSSSFSGRVLGIGPPWKGMVITGSWKKLLCLFLIIKHSFPETIALDFGWFWKVAARMVNEATTLTLYMDQWPWFALFISHVPMQDSSKYENGHISKKLGIVLQ
jgi:hypothetical protein